MPDVAGGLGLHVQPHRQERPADHATSILDSQVIEEIFSGRDHQLERPGHRIGSTPNWPATCRPPKILPVYRVDASGENYLLADYLLHMDGPALRDFQNAMQSGIAVGQPSAGWPSRMAEPASSASYPGWSDGDTIGQNGSDNAANYVSRPSSNGAITYVETAYAKEHNMPVASVVNASGNAVQPTSVNDATALEKAILYSDLTQNLTGVYTNPLPNAYPISSYSYFVTPCSPSPGPNSRDQVQRPEWDSLRSLRRRVRRSGNFVDFVACAGQDEMASARLLAPSPQPGRRRTSTRSAG